LTANLVVFDIETIPDKRNFDGHGFPKPLFHIPVAISFLHAEISHTDRYERYELKELRCGGEPDYDEAKLLKAFIDFIERLKPRLVSYNGRSFDLPVIKYRAMVHSLPAPLITSQEYTYRYSANCHTDLLDVLSDFGASSRAKLDEVCSILGLPGKIGVDGSMVAGMFVYFAYTQAEIKAVVGYEIKAAFYKIGGLSKGSDVRISGIKVGTVTNHALDSKTYDALVSMSIKSELKLPKDTVATIASGGLLGGKYVRLEPGKEKTYLEAGGMISKTKDFRSLEDQVGEIIFLATGGSESSGPKQ